jgi:antitoxin component HigA of HigAB toxin-antitoxin module
VFQASHLYRQKTPRVKAALTATSKLTLNHVRTLARTFAVFADLFLW